MYSRRLGSRFLRLDTETREYEIKREFLLTTQLQSVSHTECRVRKQVVSEGFVAILITNTMARSEQRRRLGETAPADDAARKQRIA
jgi:hypothetical protein